MAEPGPRPRPANLAPALARIGPIGAVGETLRASRAYRAGGAPRATCGACRAGRHWIGYALIAVLIAMLVSRPPIACTHCRGMRGTGTGFTRAFNVQLSGQWGKGSRAAVAMLDKLLGTT